MNWQILVLASCPFTLKNTAGWQHAGVVAGCEDCKQGWMRGLGRKQQMLGMQGSWAAGWQPAGVVAGCEDWVANNKCWECRDLGLQVGNLQVLWLDVRTGSQTNAGDAGILGCRLATRAGVVAGCEDWVANNKCWGCRDLELQVSNLQVLWLVERTCRKHKMLRMQGSQSPTTNTGDAGILGCNKCWGCRHLGLQVGNLQVLSGSRATNAGDARILGCRLATCRCCGWL